MTLTLPKRTLELARGTFLHGNAYAIQWLKNQALRVQDDEACVTMAVRYAGRALEFASHRLRANAGICVEAVRQDRTAIEFVARVVRRDVVLATLPRLYRWALTRLRQQRAAPVFAQVDQWLIRREEDGFSQSVKRWREGARCHPPPMGCATSESACSGSSRTPRSSTPSATR